MRDSFWSRRVPADLSSEVEKKTLFIKASLQTARFFFFRLVFFFLLFFLNTAPHGLGTKKIAHISVQGEAEITGR